jgi:phosphatidylglycerol:prolipoprotein diacylglycerol transferase
LDRVLFHLGTIPIYTFGITIAVGVMAAYWLIVNSAKKVNIDENIVDTLFLLLLIAGFFGARIFYVLFYNPAYYLDQPWKIVEVSEGGLSIHGGILGAVIVGWWYMKKSNIPVWSTADLLSPAAILAQGIARVGCDVFGRAISNVLPWGVFFHGQVVHPVQIYETILDLGLFVWLWGKKSKQKYQGQIFVYYLAGYAGIRFILEFFRTNPLVLWNLTPAHLSSIIFLLAALGLGRWLSTHNSMPESRVENNLGPGKTVYLPTVILVFLCITVFYILNLT